MKLRTLVALLMVGLLAFAACGDDADPLADLQGESSSEDPGNDDGGNDDGDNASGEFDLGNEDCNFGLEVLQNNPLADAFTGEADPEQLEASVELMNEMAAAAPEEIRDDFVILADAYSQIVTLFASGDFDPNDPAGMDVEMLTALQELSEGLDQAAITEASANVSEFFAENCTTQ